MLLLDWRTRAVRILDLQNGHADRPDSGVLGLTTHQIADGIDWPPLYG